MKKILLVAAILFGTNVHAQTLDPHSIAPPEILKMDSLPNAGELLLRYCLIGNHLCVERSTSCHGQCCEQVTADAEGYGCSGDVYGSIPPGYRYAGWRCQMYEEPVGDMKVEGNAGPVPSYIKQCTNRR